MKLYDLKDQTILIAAALHSGVGPVTFIELQDRMCRLGFEYGIREDLWTRTTIVAIAAGVQELQALGYATRRRGDVWGPGMCPIDPVAACRRLAGKERRTLVELAKVLSGVVAELEAHHETER